MTEDELLDERWKVQYRADYSARYHRKRATFLRTCDTMMTALTLVAGAAAFGDLADSAPTIVLQIGAAFITVISIIQITTKIGEASFQHREWMKNWVKLGLKVKQKSIPTKEDIDVWELDIATTESECVSEFRALRILCEDESARYLNIPNRQHRIWLLQRVFANFGTFQPVIPLLGNEGSSLTEMNSPTLEHQPSAP